MDFRQIVVAALPERLGHAYARDRFFRFFEPYISQPRQGIGTKLVEQRADRLRRRTRVSRIGGSSLPDPRPVTRPLRTIQRDAGFRTNSCKAADTVVGRNATLVLSQQKLGPLKLSGVDQHPSQAQANLLGGRPASIDGQKLLEACAVTRLEQRRVLGLHALCRCAISRAGK